MLRFRAATTISILLAVAPVAVTQSVFELSSSGYFVRGGVNVTAFQDIYPEGHQGGVGIIQHGVRTVSNGDLRLEATPGQWSPVPRQISRDVDTSANVITTRLAYPDPEKDRTGFNPILYPDLELEYDVRVSGDGDAVRIFVDLDSPLPDEWVGKVGFILELYPTSLFGKSWQLGGRSGIFPRQPNGPVVRDENGEVQSVPFSTGPRLTVAAENPEQHLEIENLTGNLELLDGRVKHNNGWFIVRTTVPPGTAESAIQWIVRPNVVPGWKYEPVIQVSQVGYHPDQRKIAVVEIDASDNEMGSIELLRVLPGGGFATVTTAEPEQWGEFLRYRYLRFDFSQATEEGMYVIRYRGQTTHPFRIAGDVYGKDVWQPTLEYFLPVQMCHMRVEQQYRVWHGACHLDDARMAPADSNHFDGYVQGPDLLTSFESGVTVPGLNRGGWHDAGDDDLRIESQADEVYILAAAYELFDVDHDDTTIDQERLVARIHEPDGVPDLLQQVEHGVLTIIGPYRSMGRFYRGIIVPTLEQYVMLGDLINSTDNLYYDPLLRDGERTATTSSVPDDRWVFTEQHAGHEMKGVAALAIAARVLSEYDPELSVEALAAAEAVWAQEREMDRGFADWVRATSELLLSTDAAPYRDALLGAQDRIVEEIRGVGWTIGRALPRIGNEGFETAVRAAVAADFARVVEEQKSNPYGVPYEPHIWGAGWGIQRFGVGQYFLHHAFPDLVSAEYILNALNFVLGVHPGSNVASFASGVGATSMTTAYGFNRADWSYIPGGVVSGTALIQPDFPELKNFPYLWQQGEYVMGGGATHFMFLVMAADDVLNGRHPGLDPGSRFETLNEKR